MKVLSYGEALLRFAPRSEDSRSVHGEELGVCTALARLGVDVAWASVLPAGPLGDVIRSCAEEAGVHLDHVRTLEGEDKEVGTFHVLADGRAHCQRRHSAFCTQPPGLFCWPEILAERSRGCSLTWLHMTGVTPMLGKEPASSWTAAIRAGRDAGATMSLDLNYNPQLGPFADLWGAVEPELGCVDLLVLSVHSAYALADHLGLGEQRGEVDATATPAKRIRLTAGEGSGPFTQVLREVHSRLNGPAVACSLLEGQDQGPSGRQRLCSVLVDADGVHWVGSEPTICEPRDELRGGGSAWVAGTIDALGRRLMDAGVRRPSRTGKVVALGKECAADVLHSGQVLAALAEERRGEHSAATRKDFDIAKSHLPGQAQQRVKDALDRLMKAKVIAILRAKHELRAVERAAELADLGYRAIEVTVDSVGFSEGTLLPAVVKAVGDRCVVGIGTVTRLSQLEQAASAGAHFALSPVRPTAGWGPAGFVRECHRRGVLAMPAAFTPQEIYECVEEQGAYTVKIFPAQLWSPSALKDLRRIGDFGKYLLCPSGGITPANAEAWLEAGAAGVGMGSCLVGKDVAVSPEDAASLAAAENDWHSHAKPAATALAKRLLLTGC